MDDLVVGAVEMQPDAVAVYIVDVAVLDDAVLELASI